jgi:hypothetical protein
MNTLRQRVFTNWNFVRFLRLGLGVWILVMAIQSRDWPIGLLSGLFIWMAVTNTGCCGANGCAAPNNMPRRRDGPVSMDNEGIQEIK